MRIRNIEIVPVAAIEPSVQLAASPFLSELSHDPSWIAEEHLRSQL
jgi:hypothetical protein